MQADFMNGFDKAGLHGLAIACQRALLMQAYVELPWWQKLTQETRYRWRFESLWVISRAYKHTVETYGSKGTLTLGLWIDWVQFLDTLPPELVRQWAAMPWWKRMRYARKTMSWLAYVQELREDYVRRVTEGTSPASTA
jgi:hypothetical protein